MSRNQSNKCVELIQARFGQWLVICDGGTNSRWQRYWYCRCDCGKERRVLEFNLTSGRSRSCGCSYGAGSIDDLTGKIFGRWAVIEPAGKNRYWQRMWRCRCQCGTIRLVVEHALLRGKSVSCSCERNEKTSLRDRTHGESHTSEWLAWTNIKQRCYNARNSSYRHYGAKGITVCQGFQESAEWFLSIMGKKPSPDHSIDRINVHAGYWCGACEECVSQSRALNCRWATVKEQAQNRTNSRILVLDNVALPITEWARKLNCSYLTIQARLDAGWPLAKALTQPIRKWTSRR